MDRKGEASVGMLIAVAVAVIVGAVLLTASAQNLGTVRNTNIYNTSLSSANGTTGYLDTNCQAWQGGTATVYNTTGGLLIGSGNYSITNYVVSNGALVTRFNVTAQDTLGIQNGNWYVYRVCEPFGYDTSSGGRALAELIIVFFALAIGVIALSPTLRDSILNGMRR